jgi:hypothetical protein
MFGIFKKKTKPAVDFKSSQFSPKGRLSCAEAILAVWHRIPAIFSLRQVVSGVHDASGAMFLDSTVSACMRRLKHQNKIDFLVDDRTISRYRKL